MSMNIDAAMLIAVEEARDKCKGVADITERLREAMKVCHDHWMLRGEPAQMKAAVAAALMESPEEEKDRIVRSFKSLSQASAVLQAAMAGVPLDLENMPVPDADVLPLMGLWREVRSGAR